MWQQEILKGSANNPETEEIHPEGSLSTTLQTGLPAGTYCDVISGDKIDGNCTGIKVYVSGDGTAQFSISNTSGDPFIAIHVEPKL